VSSFNKQPQESDSDAELSGQVVQPSTGQVASTFSEVGYLASTGQVILSPNEVEILSSNEVELLPSNDSEGEYSYVGNSPQQEFPFNLMDELENGMDIPDISNVQQMSKEEFKACIQQQFEQVILKLVYPALASIILRVQK
jgi:hypothetical protein